MPACELKFPGCFAGCILAVSGKVAPQHERACLRIWILIRVPRVEPRLRLLIELDEVRVSMLWRQQQHSK